MDDLISRQAVIDALHMHLMYRMGTDSNKKRLDEWINNLPSAQPERRGGEWIEVVRCKDCKYFENQCDCVKHSADILGYVIEVTPDDYCSYGERKEDDER